MFDITEKNDIIILCAKTYPFKKGIMIWNIHLNRQKIEYLSLVTV